MALSGRMSHETSESPTAPGAGARPGDRPRAGESVRTPAGQMLNKVPEVTIRDAASRSSIHLPRLNSRATTQWVPVRCRALTRDCPAPEETCACAPAPGRRPDHATYARSGPAFATEGRATLPPDAPQVVGAAYGADLPGRRGALP
ncbi:hypothetical protein Slala05_04810 [Streptomyces lavendulae subsp. lavendulae]|nr:hypothetical protein Slala05_04810 [Streptomyces lavendulae subsp. lavendulae]